MKVEVKIKSVGELTSGQKKDGSGTWFARDVILESNDGSLYPDEFVIRATGALAQSNSLAEGLCYLADISFSKREWNGRYFADIYLRNLEASQKENPF